MILKKKPSVWIVATLASSLWLAGCGDSGNLSSTATTGGTTDVTTPVEPFVQTQIDVSAASIIGAATKNTGGEITVTSTDYSLPKMMEENGSFSMTIPSGPAPEIPARRTIASAGGATLNFGDPVMLKYDMFSWNKGELVDSSAQYDEAYTVKSGVSDELPIPDYLAKSLLGRSLGDTIQVVLPVGTEDLPSQLDKEDAYILVVTLL